MIEITLNVIVFYVAFGAGSSTTLMFILFLDNPEWVLSHIRRDGFMGEYLKMWAMLWICWPYFLWKIITH